MTVDCRGVQENAGRRVAQENLAREVSVAPMETGRKEIVALLVQKVRLATLARGAQLVQLVPLARMESQAHGDLQARKTARLESRTRRKLFAAGQGQRRSALHTQCLSGVLPVVASPLLSSGGSIPSRQQSSASVVKFKPLVMFTQKP